MKVKSLSRVFTIPRTATYQAPPSMGFSRQEFWSGVPLLSPRNWHRVPENSCHLLHTYYCYQLCFNDSLIVSLDPSTVLIDEIGIVIVVVVTLTLKIKKAKHREFK